MKDKETRTVWCSEVEGSLKVQYQVKNPEEDITYLNYLQERKEMVELLRKSGKLVKSAVKSRKKTKKRTTPCGGDSLKSLDFTGFLTWRSSAHLLYLQLDQSSLERYE